MFRRLRPLFLLAASAAPLAAQSSSLADSATKLIRLGL